MIWKYLLFAGLLVVCLTSALTLVPVDVDSQPNTSAWNYQVRLNNGKMNDSMSWCGNVPDGNLPGLDDRDCVKYFPRKFVREAWQCYSYHSKSNMAGYYRNIGDALNNAENVLSAAVPPTKAHIAVILVKRCLEEDGAPYYRVISNGNHLSTYYAWSSTKEFAMSAAAGRMRGVCQFGLEGVEKNTGIPLGDFGTVIATYDKRHGYSSNAQARYFSDIGGRDRERNIIRKVIGRTNEDGLANWGAMYPSDLGFTFSNNGRVCSITPITDMSFDGEAVETDISTFTEADWLRRLAMHRELDDSSRIPGVTWNDVMTIFHGAGNASSLFGNLEYGGLSADTSVWLQKSVNIRDVDDKAKGQWRIFSKMGCGYTATRQRFEFVYNAYTCMPQLDSKYYPITNAGVEMSMSVFSWGDNEPVVDANMQLWVNAAMAAAKKL